MRADSTSKSTRGGATRDDGTRETIVAFAGDVRPTDVDEILFVCVECEGEDGQDGVLGDG